MNFICAERISSAPRLQDGGTSEAGTQATGRQHSGAVDVRTQTPPLAHVRCFDGPLVGLEVPVTPLWAGPGKVRGKHLRTH